MTKFELKRKEHRAMLDLVAQIPDARILRRRMLFCGWMTVNRLPTLLSDLA